MPKVTSKGKIRIRSFGCMKHSTANLNELLMLIGYIRLAAQQESAVFKYDNYQEWAD